MAIISQRRPTVWEWRAVLESRWSSASARLRTVASCAWASTLRLPATAPRVLRDLGAVDDGAVAPQRLGGVERAVGGGDEAGEVLGVSREGRDADGGGQLQCAACE